MRVYFYGYDDCTGSGLAPGSVIAFAESRAEADQVALRIYGPNWPLSPQTLFIGEMECVPGAAVVAASYYGVGFDFDPQPNTEKSIG